MRSATASVGDFRAPLVRRQGRLGSPASCDGLLRQPPRDAGGFQKRAPVHDPNISVGIWHAISLMMPVHAEREVIHAFDQAAAFGQVIYGARKARNLRQTDLAEFSGVTQADISRIERGQVAPTTQTLLKLTAALGVEIQFVLAEPGAAPAESISLRPCRRLSQRAPLTTRSTAAIRRDAHR